MTNTHIFNICTNYTSVKKIRFKIFDIFSDTAKIWLSPLLLRFWPVYEVSGTITFSWTMPPYKSNSMRYYVSSYLTLSPNRSRSSSTASSSMGAGPDLTTTRKILIISMLIFFKNLDFYSFWICRRWPSQAFHWDSGRAGLVPGTIGNNANPQICVRHGIQQGNNISSADSNLFYELKKKNWA